MKIELLQDWEHPQLGLYPAGSTVELYDDDALPMITAGQAKQVPEGTKTKRLTPEQSSSRTALSAPPTDCVAPTPPPVVEVVPEARRKARETE